MELHGQDAPLDGEDQKERLDRELSELLEEIRVALPGVQMLFAFLLAVPFQSRWTHVTEPQRDVYFAALCLTLFATVMLIAPSAYHRTNFRAYDKRRLIVIASRLALAGIASLAAAMTGVIYVIGEQLFGTPQALAFSALAALLFVAMWGALPLRDRLRMQRAQLS
ncbi:MAG: hypothetical protein JWM86_2493 [Thermoleophilia bacterium]|nr:hypothetical protein [Thermoleophilia bacterium]